MLSSFYITLLAQASDAVQQLPSTGNSKLDTALYFLGSILGLREGTYWISRLRRKAEETVDSAQIMLKHIEAAASTQEKMLETLSELNINLKLLNQRMEHVERDILELRRDHPS